MSTDPFTPRQVLLDLKKLLNNSRVCWDLDEEKKEIGFYDCKKDNDWNVGLSVYGTLTKYVFFKTKLLLELKFIKPTYTNFYYLSKFQLFLFTIQSKLRIQILEPTYFLRWHGKELANILTQQQVFEAKKKGVLWIVEQPNNILQLFQEYDSLALKLGYDSPILTRLE